MKTGTGQCSGGVNSRDDEADRPEYYSCPGFMDEGRGFPEIQASSRLRSSSKPSSF